MSWKGLENNLTQLKILAKISEVDDLNLKLKLFALKDYWNKTLQSGKKYLEECEKLEKEYDTKYNKIYENVDDIQSGAKKVLKTELMNTDRYFDDCERINLIKPQLTKRMNRYWYKVIKQNLIWEHCSLLEEKLLKKIKGINMERKTKLEGADYIIRVSFEENQYIINDTLEIIVKEYPAKCYEIIECDTIYWTEENKLLGLLLNKKQPIDKYLKSFFVLWDIWKLYHDKGSITKHHIDYYANIKNLMAKDLIEEVIPNSGISYVAEYIPMEEYSP